MCPKLPNPASKGYTGPSRSRSNRRSCFVARCSWAWPHRPARSRLSFRPLPRWCLAVRPRRPVLFGPQSRCWTLTLVKSLPRRLDLLLSGLSSGSRASRAVMGWSASAHNIRPNRCLWGMEVLAATLRAVYVEWRFAYASRACSQASCLLLYPSPQPRRIPRRRTLQRPHPLLLIRLASALANQRI